MSNAKRLVSMFIAVPPAASLALLGCASSPFSPGLLSQLERDLASPAPIERALVERATTLAHNDGSLPASTPADIDAANVDDLVALALARNPAILAAEQRLLRLHERIAQVTSLDDPVFSVTPIGDMAETAAGQVQVMTSLSQRLPFPGKLEARGDVARAGVAIAEQELVQIRLRVEGDVRRAHWRLYDSARAIAITTRSAAALEQAIGAARAKLRAGTGGQDAVLRISVERQGLEQELLELAQRRASAVAMLNALVDRAPDAPIADPPAIDIPEFDEQLSALLAQATHRNPEVRAALERLAQFQSQRRLAGLARAPDFTLSASYNTVENDGIAASATGEDQWRLGVSFNLPIWFERLDAAEREATRGAIESAGEAVEASRRIEFAVLDAHARVRSLRDQALLLRDVIVPEAQLAVESSLAAYRTGEGGFLTVIDNWRTALRVELMLERSVAGMQQAQADLRQAVADTNPSQTPAESSRERTNHD